MTSPFALPKQPPTPATEPRLRPDAALQTLDLWVTWVGRFYRVYKLNPPIPAGQDDETAVKAVTEIYDAGLPALKKLAETK